MLKGKTFTAIILFVCSQIVIAAPGGNKGGGGNAEVVAAPEIHSIKIDYEHDQLLIQGANLDLATAAGTIAGVALPAPDGILSSDTILVFDVTDSIAAAVDELGNYIITLSTSGVDFSVTAFIPFALSTNTPPPPPGVDCPCSTEWDIVSGSASPDGFLGQTAYCDVQTPDYVTAQYWDVPANNYWVLWTGWDASASSYYCELYIDGSKYLITEDQFNNCSTYLTGLIEVWGSQGDVCLF